MEILKQKAIKGYELKEKIGTGGFGAVYRAYQSTIGREVAVKVILPALANQSDFIRRFEGEAQVVARLEHPHITPLYDYWRDPEGAYLVMRWLRGGSLQDALKAGKFELRTAALLLDQIAGALSLAHRHGIIHRDIKPANILLDEDGNAYLTDFGIAKDLNLQGNNTQPDMIVGSLDYISPEQARSETVTSRTDIYSLGVTLFEVITGHHPFENLTSIERLYKHINDPLPEIMGLGAAISEQLNHVIQKATAKNPEQRYPDALAFAADFREAIGLNRNSTTVVELLTQREHEILALIIEGCSNKEIAQKLTITYGTVKWYVSQIYDKLGVRGRVQAMVRARELNLLSRDRESLEALAIPTEDFHPDNPYKGLRAFQSADNQDFFGREKLISKLLKRMEERAEFGRFLAVVGPSGSGKSSLVKAGLIPALWRGEIPGSEKWYIVEMTPGTHPIDELEIALMKLAANQAGNLHEQLNRDANGLVRTANLILPNDGTELVLVIDQFEEVFTMLDNETERNHFLDLLYAAISDAKSRVRIIITLRADFYDRPLHYPKFGELLKGRLETILPLSAEELERAISKPAERVGVVFEAGLVASMVADMNYQAGALPLLQYALTELFEHRKGRLLSREAYDAMGKSTGALAKRAEEIYESFDEAGKAAARQLFLRLVTVTEGTEDTRRRASRLEVLGLGNDSETIEEVIDTYSNYRLLTLDNDPINREPSVELAHEAILREWERLREWLNASRDELRIQRQLVTMAKEWSDASRDEGLLARGSRLESFEIWTQNTEILLTPLEKEYLSKSLAALQAEMQKEAEQEAREERLAQRSQSFLKVLVLVLTLATLLSGGLASYAFNREAEAQENFASAESQRLAAEANLVMANENSGELAALLAIRGLQSAYSPQADMALQTASRDDYGLRLFVTSKPSGIVRYSPDGRYILTLDSDSKLTIWDVNTGEIIREFPSYISRNTLGAAVFSPDGRSVLYSPNTLENIALIVDIASGEELLRFVGNTTAVMALDFSPDGTSLATSSQDGTIILWNAATGQEIRRYTGQHRAGATVRTLDFSPDGLMLATGADDRTVALWDVETGEAIALLTGFSARLNCVTFSPDGHLLLASAPDAILRLWDVETRSEIRQFNGHSEGLFASQFSPDGRYVLSTSLDTTARVWDIETGEELRRINGHTSAVYDASFSPDGRNIVTASRDGTVRLWDFEQGNDFGVLAGTVGTYFGIKYSPDARYLATGSNYDVYLRDANSFEILWVASHSDAVLQIDFTPDSRYILAGYRDRRSILWDTETGIAVYTLNAGGLSGLALSPDGSFFVTAAADGLYAWDTLSGEQIRRVSDLVIPDARMEFLSNNELAVSGSAVIQVIDLNTGAILQAIDTQSGVIQDISYSADRSMMFTSGIDTTARLWNRENGTLLQSFVGHTNRIWFVGLSPDERFLLSAGQEGTARLWDVQTGQELRRFVGLGAVQSAAFSPDGSMVLVGSTNGNLYMSPISIETIIEQVCGRVLRDLTAAERSQYDIRDDRATCNDE